MTDFPSQGPDQAFGNPLSPTHQRETAHHRRRFKTLRAIGALVVREMSTSYGRSPGGYFWAVMEPVAGIALLTVVFSMMLKTPALGTNFQIYYATGFLPFILYREVSSKMATSIRFSRSLLFYPTVTYADALVARFILTLVTQVMIFFLVIGGILNIWETRTWMEPSLILSSLFGAAVLGIGIGTLNCVLISMVTFWDHTWNVLNRPLVVISGVIFLHDNIPEPWKSYLWWNPLVHIVGQMRRGFYPTYEGEYVNMYYPIGVGLVLTVIGLILLNRFNRWILNFS